MALEPGLTPIGREPEREALASHVARARAGDGSIVLLATARQRAIRLGAEIDYRVGDCEHREELHRTWVDFFESNYRENGEIVHAREYLLVIAERA